MLMNTSRVFRKSSEQLTLRVCTLTAKPVFSDTLLLHSSFQILVNFVESRPGSEVARELHRLYEYWVLERPRWIYEEETAKEYNDITEAADIKDRRREKDQQMLEQLIEHRSLLC